MADLSDELRKLGYEPTGKESPFEETGELWSNSYELVCDETALVIRKDSSGKTSNNSSRERVYRYRNTEKVKLYGGYVSSYDWGDDGDGRFTYDRV